jgi:hypothetical protein
MTRSRSTRLAFPALLLAITAVLAGCADPVEPEVASAPEAAMLAPDGPAMASTDACWGQASKVYARMGLMGEHSAQQPTPRLGLANLARALYDQGVIAEPTMEALGAFVASALGLSIDACGT